MVGQTIKHYEIKELIGRGAMGTVYRAYDKALDRDVAVKFLSSETDRAPAEIERFFREARAAAGLNHPNVLVIHDVGEHRGSGYFVMELLKGSSLRQMIRDGKQPGWREGMKIVIQILGVLEAANAGGLLHRKFDSGYQIKIPEAMVPVVTQCVYCGGEIKGPSLFCRLCGSGMPKDRGALAKLIILEGESTREYLISQQERYLGRDASSDIVLDDDQVSGRHIRIGYEGGEFRVRDLGSTNGTFVNGERIGGSVILKNEDLVKIGETIIKLMV